MSKSVEDLKLEVSSLKEEQVQIASDFASYRDKVGQEVVAILKQAGVFEQVNQLELERESRKHRDQKRVDDLSSLIHELELSIDSLEVPLLDPSFIQVVENESNE